jgi:hypothetical protein
MKFTHADRSNWVADRSNCDGNTFLQAKTKAALDQATTQLRAALVDADKGAGESDAVAAAYTEALEQAKVKFAALNAQIAALTVCGATFSICVCPPVRVRVL